MTRTRTIIMALAAAAAICAVRAPARAAGTLPVTLGLGVFQPSTTTISYPNSPATYSQQDGFSAEASLGPIFETGVQVSVLALSQRDNVSTQFPGFPASSFTITQVPVLIESTGARFGPVRLGGGLGYDFVSYPASSGPSNGSGVVGDTFLQVGIGSGAALEGKYLFGGQAGLGGFFVGISTKL
jgi:hypothetical protein